MVLVTLLFIGYIVFLIYAVSRSWDAVIPSSQDAEQSKAQDWEDGEFLSHKAPQTRKSSDNVRMMLFEWERYKKGDFVFDTDDYPLTKKPKK